MEDDAGETKASLLPDQEQVIRDEWGRILDQCADLDCSTVQLFGYQDDSFVPDRTGVLFGVGDSHFVITAAHYLPEIARNNIPIFLPPTNPSQRPIQLVGRTLITEQETIDIAVWELTQDVVEQLVPTRRFLGMMDVDLRSVSLQGLYLITGYPISYTVVSPEAVRPTVLKYVAFIFSGDLDAVDNFDPSTHILLQHQRHGQSVQGQAFSAPRMNGMSGGGIWRLLELRPNWNQDWKRSDVKLVAIQNRCLHDQYCKGAWIIHALRLIWDSFPQLRPALRLDFNGIR